MQRRLTRGCKSKSTAKLYDVFGQLYCLRRLPVTSSYYLDIVGVYLVGVYLHKEPWYRATQTYTQVQVYSQIVRHIWILVLFTQTYTHDMMAPFPARCNGSVIESCYLDSLTIQKVVLFTQTYTHDMMAPFLARYDGSVIESCYLDSLTIKRVIRSEQTFTHDMMAVFRQILSIIKYMEASHVLDTMALFNSRWLCSIVIKLFRQSSMTLFDSHQKKRKPLMYVTSYVRDTMCQRLSTIWGGQISRLLKIIGLFCRISSLLQGSFAKETYNFTEPTNRSHPIVVRFGQSYDLASCNI